MKQDNQQKSQSRNKGLKVSKGSATAGAKQLATKPKKDDDEQHPPTTIHHDDQGEWVDFSDEEDGDTSTEDGEWDPANPDESELVEKLAYARFLAEMFPSKYQETKAKLLETQSGKTAAGGREDVSSPTKTKRKRGKVTKTKTVKSNPKASKKKHEVTEDEDEDEEQHQDAGETEDESEDSGTDSSDESEYDESDSDEFDLEELFGGDARVNIVLTIGDPSEFEQEEEDYEETSDDETADDDDEDEDDEEDEDAVFDLEKMLTKRHTRSSAAQNSAKSKKAIRNKEQTETLKEKGKEKQKRKEKEKGNTDGKKRKSSTSSSAAASAKTSRSTSSSVSKETRENEKELLALLKEQTEKLRSTKKHSKSQLLDDLGELAAEYETYLTKEEKKNEKKRRKENADQFKKLMSEKNSTNEVNYFYNLAPEKQELILDKMKAMNESYKITVPYRFKVLELDIPDNLKYLVTKKVAMLKKMDPSSGEYHKIRNWIDTFMMIPFGSYKSLNISMEAGPSKCVDYMRNAVKVLDGCVYGLNDAKVQILQMIGTWISNPNAVGNAIAIKGPPGTGKTTLVKEGISQILERPFEFIALGGSTDSSFLEGHSYTYEGSTWGKIVSTLIKSKCMNPIIYFDELDKVSDTPKGEEIIGILTHLIDTSQNTQFHDKYFANVDLDLSKCTFIFSYNDENKINPILKDRMYKIETKGYDAKDKLVISRDYLLPTALKLVGFTPEDVIISDDILQYIISNYTEDEKGVRNLKRCLEILLTKLNLYRLTTPAGAESDDAASIKERLFKNSLLKDVTFPYTVDTECVQKLMLKKEVDQIMATLYS